MDRGSLGSEDRFIDRISFELRDLSMVGLVGASDGGGAGTDTPASVLDIAKRHRLHTQAANDATIDVDSMTMLVTMLVCCHGFAGAWQRLRR